MNRVLILLTIQIIYAVVLKISVYTCIPSLFMGVVNPIPFPSKKLKAWFFLFFLFGEVLEEKKEKYAKEKEKGAGAKKKN